MIRIAMTILAMVLAATVAFSQSKPETKAAPTVDQILDRYVEAIGGKTALEKLSSRSTKGAIEMMPMGIKGKVESVATKNNKTLSILNLDGVGEFLEGYDGAISWSKDPINGYREKSGAELAFVKRAAVFHRELKMREIYAKLELKGKEKVAGRDCWLIVATPAEGAPEKLFFDAQSGLLTRSDIELETPQGSMAFELYFEDYRPIDGIQVAHLLRRSNPSLNLTVRFEEVKHNVTVDEAKFNKPAAK